MTVLSDQIMRRVRGHGRGGWVFGPKDFLDQGNRAAVDQVLSRLTKRGVLRRVARGLYDWPRQSRLLNRATPANVDAAVSAIARRDGTRIMPNGIRAAHRLGLTNAVPAKSDYWTDGRTRNIQLGGRTIRFKHMNPAFMGWADRPAGPVVSALAWLGPTIANDPAIIDRLGQRLPDEVKQDLKHGAAKLPTWALPIIQQMDTQMADVA